MPNLEISIHTIGLVIQTHNQDISLVEILCDENEISSLEAALKDREPNPLQKLYDQRNSLSQEETELEDFIEGLLSQPFIDPEIQKQGIDFFKSKSKIDEFRRSEREAAEVIAEYAFRIYRSAPSYTDFILKGKTKGVRVRVLELRPNTQQAASPL